MREFLSVLCALGFSLLLSACSSGGSAASSGGGTTTGAGTGGTTGGTTTGGSTGSTTGGSTTGGSTTGGSTTGGSTTGGSTTGGSTTGGSTTGGSTTGGTTGTSSAINPITGFQDSTPITRSSVSDGQAQIVLADGTSAQSYKIMVGSRLRRYVIIRPDTPLLARAPILLVLHPDGTSPESTAYISQISDYVLTQGFWAVLPEGLGALSPSWDDDPSALGEQNVDVPFISALIDSLSALSTVDSLRIYAAGFSNGGFMADRLACELSHKVAAFGVIAATMHNSEAAICSPAVTRPKVYFLGTGDLVVPYNGNFPDAPTGLNSADGTMSFWAGAAQQNCTGPVVMAPEINNLPDTTSVQLADYSGCRAGTRLQLYTINGGGHQWPGGQVGGVGTNTNEIQASGLIWLFVRGYHL